VLTEFCRPDAQPVIKGVNLSIKPGEHVAVCGRSGSGKSSLMLSLLQMIDIQSGHIIIDGIDLGTIGRASVRSRFNAVPQEPFLMPGTMRFNVDPFQTATDEEITCALERVRLWSVVAEQGGLDKEIDTGAWSAGQKQLLCLARAMVRKSQLLILDEATSSVDSETESIMQQIIDVEFKHCTVIAIMHRLKHISKYDKVALLDNGFLVEYDNPSVLLAKDSSFANLQKVGGGH
jgi:ATP-binding cassette, subfamily C (CFTR/MRP), member 1